MNVESAVQLLQTRMANPVLPKLKQDDIPDELRSQGQVLDMADMDGGAATRRCSEEDGATQATNLGGVLRQDRERNEEEREDNE